jgi:hypothetical protein
MSSATFASAPPRSRGERGAAERARSSERRFPLPLDDIAREPPTMTPGGSEGPARPIRQPETIDYSGCFGSRAARQLSGGSKCRR